MNAEYGQIIDMIKGKDKFIEFGGPTRFLDVDSGEGLALYKHLGVIDGANLVENNVWFGDKFKVDMSYNYSEGKSGAMFDVDVADANSLKKITGKYDCIISSHQIEHLANPIKALLLWKDILSVGGMILSFIPDKRYIFDSNRPDTTMGHLVSDYTNNVGEDDMTHIKEILSHRPDQMSERMKYENNIVYRMAHHHCFTPELVKKMYEYCGYEILYNFKNDPMNIVSLVKKI